MSRLIEPERAAVDRPLVDGDAVGTFVVLHVPGHSPGTIALWREADRVLVVGHNPVNLSADPKAPRWLHLPRSLNHDNDQARESARRLAGLRPALVVTLHGHPAAAPDAWAEALSRH